ncbi:hypothetical protein [Methylobacterium segetis]|uniref:hypothetical protein n=1 Tax=Methylobacterium segetis TaxID=2488750 RepID=UPI00104B02EA|nr:hypothetical protein [Methylobacterium segetis]
MLELLKNIWDRSVNEGGVVHGAPLLFAISVFFLTSVAAISVWTVINWSYSSRMESLEGRLKLKDDQIADYKEKLSGATPLEAKQRIDALEYQIKALSPRRISSDQKQIIINNLAGIKSIVSIAQDMAAPDAKQLSADLAAAFRGAGWGVMLPMVLGPSNVPPSGIALRVRDANALQPIEVRARSALQAAGIEFEVQGGMRRTNLQNTPQDSKYSSISHEPDPEVEILVTTRSN